MTPRGATLDAARGGAGPAPQPIPYAPAIPEPQDTPYPGVLQLRVDATDVERGIFVVQESIPVVQAGLQLLLYPKWLPGFHAPQAPIELFAGLAIEAGGAALPWRRHPVTVNAFLVDVPEGAATLEVSFQFLSPTDASQGRVLCTPDMLCLPWNTVVLYPAGHYARQITVAASLTVPSGWELSCALDHGAQEGLTRHFEAAPLDVLIDSPVLAGRHYRRIALDPQVALTVVGDQPHMLDATADQIVLHRAVVEQADRLFGSRPFDRFEMLLALSDALSSAGVEHHRSFEAVSEPGYFADWDRAFTRRDTIPHEYVHSWNGKHRRGADSWSPCFEKPIRNSLMWVYEGQTQYWTNVLCARSGLWSLEQTLGALAVTAARCDVRPGSRWRPTIDTTRDPIIAARAPLPWASWQRSEDYYAEGALMWLEVDTRLREMTSDARSLDDFAKAFFGGIGGSWATRTYVFDDVVCALEVLAPFDWRAFFEAQLTETHDRAPLSGFERGGYRLDYRPVPNPYQASSEQLSGELDLTHSLGLTLDKDGKLTDVLWGGPAFAARLTVGTQIVAVDGRSYAPDAMTRAVAAAAASGQVTLVTQTGGRVRPVTVDYDGGLRFPWLARIDAAAPARLDDILRKREA